MSELDPWEVISLTMCLVAVLVVSTVVVSKIADLVLNKTKKKEKK